MIRLIVGFIIGVIVSRNAQQYSTPFWGAIVLGAILGATLFYFFGRRDKNIAVATAVATAISASKSEAEAKAAAVAQSAVNVYLQSGQVPTQQEIVAIYDHTEIANDAIRSIESREHSELDRTRNSTGSDLPISI